MVALFYLIEIGRELEFEFKDESYFLSKDGSSKYCSLWKDKAEYAFNSMEEMFIGAVVDDRYFCEIWSEIEILTFY